MWNPFKVYMRAAQAEGERDALRSIVTDLRAQVSQLEQEKKELMDWLLSINGAPTLYGHEVPQVPDKQKAPSPVNPFQSARTGRDFSRIAEQLEAEGMAEFNSYKSS